MPLGLFLSILVAREIKVHRSNVSTSSLLFKVDSLELPTYLPYLGTLCWRLARVSPRQEISYLISPSTYPSTAAQLYTAEAHRLDRHLFNTTNSRQACFVENIVITISISLEETVQTIVRLILSLVGNTYRNKLLGTPSWWEECPIDRLSLSELTDDD